MISTIFSIMVFFAIPYFVLKFIYNIIAGASMRILQLQGRKRNSNDFSNNEKYVEFAPPRLFPWEYKTFSKRK